MNPFESPQPKSAAAGAANRGGALRSRLPWLQRLSPRQHQFALLASILAGGVLLLWIVLRFSSGNGAGRLPPERQSQPGEVTNIGVMPPGSQVSALDQWVGQAGRKLAQYESERDQQGRLNKDREAFESRTMQRFAELEQRLTRSPATSGGFPVTNTPVAPAVPAGTSAPAMPASAMPPAASLPTRSVAVPHASGMPSASAAPTPAPAPAAVPGIGRVSLSDRATRLTGSAGNAAPGAAQHSATPTAPKVSTFLPVSFTRGILLGGLDAPTGGQSQSNPHPVLIRLADNSVLPNQYRGAYRECLVVAAGYGDISSERAYLRTESLSCVRPDGNTMEVRIQGTVYGEDGKVGMRGRLVTKQGQMLANALLAGVVSGIGQGLSTANTSYSSSPLGTVASTDSGADAYRAGLGSGVGKALDRLAQYYIKLAENTFPVIEVDAGRQIDVVITKGVRIDVPMTPSLQNSASISTNHDARYLEPTDDQGY
jgi:conjugal transfer pilus assembly protein TraB